MIVNTDLPFLSNSKAQVINLQNYGLDNKSSERRFSYYIDFIVRKRKKVKGKTKETKMNIILNSLNLYKDSNLECFGIIILVNTYVLT